MMYSSWEGVWKQVVGRLLYTDGWVKTEDEGRVQ